MAIFLNREGIVTHFKRIVEDAKNELIIIVPFIKLTDEIKKQFNLASERNVKILIVYRENSLSDEQKKILYSYKNITLLNHPNVHSKCYLNEKSLIICSMNLYDVSIKNNREMGVLLEYFETSEKYDKNSINQKDADAFEDAIKEIGLILNSSNEEKLNISTPFKIDNFNILKTKFDLIRDLVEILNKTIKNKKFQIKEYSDSYSSIICLNYFENLDIELNISYEINELNLKKIFVKYIDLRLNHPEKQIENLHKNFAQILSEYKYKYYKVYWSWHKHPIKLYMDTVNYTEIWKKGNDFQQILDLIKGVENILKDLKNEKLFLRIQ